MAPLGPGLLLLLLLGPGARGLSEEGRWSRAAESTQPKIEFDFHKTMFNGTLISLKFSCSREVNLSVEWYLRSSRCQNEILNETQTHIYFNYPNVQLNEEDKGQYVHHKATPVKCSPHMNTNPLSLSFGNRLPLEPQHADEPKGPKESDSSAKPNEKIPQEAAKGGGKSEEKTKNDAKNEPKSQKTKRSAEKDSHDVASKEAAKAPKEAAKAPKEAAKAPAVPEQPVKETAPKTTEAKSPVQKAAEDFVVFQTWEDGPYIFLVKISSLEPELEPKPWKANIDVSMWHPVHQYTSASEWPLMVFYMVMVIVYVLYGVLWLVLLVCYWRDILRIQYWIGGVVLLGMLEKVVFYAEFQSIQTYGVSVQGAVIFAEILCSVKRMLARVLVVIASLGYGIVKPRLGVLLNRVLGVGMLYLFFSIIEGILRVKSSSQEQNSIASLTCEFALAFVDSCIVLWIFMSLVQTMKLLRVRRNLVKLSLYRHFTNTLIFAVIASVIFILWSSKTFRLTRCQSDWREVWLNDAFWRFLFSIILLVIIFLWRPSANNQRYAFVPLIDAGSEEEDEEEDQMPNEGLAEGMKMRGAKNEPNGILKGSRVDEDLKWVEENIPSSMADVVLPPLLDSDEEILTTKFEMSKME